MLTNDIIKTIETKDISIFETIWTDLKNNLLETDKQILLQEIVEYHYSDKDFSFYIIVFDKIIDSKVSLDFNIDNWAPTFLSLIVMKSSRILFDYFLKKGANINFIGDKYAFETEEIIEQETEQIKTKRYATCLDFAEEKLADLLTVDYNYSIPETNNKTISWRDIDNKEEIIIKKQDYYYLLNNHIICMTLFKRIDLLTILNHWVVRHTNN